MTGDSGFVDLRRPNQCVAVHVSSSRGRKTAPTHANTVGRGISIVETSYVGKCKKKWDLVIWGLRGQPCRVSFIGRS